MPFPPALTQFVGPNRTPIAIGFLDSPPAGVQRWQGGAVAAGCVFWDKAMRGQSFYTVPSDHYNCAVGSYTHNISLPSERSHELNGALSLMVGNKYISMSEVAAIPTLAKPPAAVAYGPLDQANFRFDVVLIAAKPAQAMLIYEAAIKAGAGGALTNALGRPACAVLPLTTSLGEASISLGCKGNRTFTGLSESEMYVSIPAAKWQALVDALVEISAANAAMETYYQERQQSFPAG